MALILAIGGSSRSGKTTLARRLASAFRRQGRRVGVLHQDDYVYPEDTLSRVNGLPDWEHPSSIRADDWLQAIRTAGDTHEVVIAEGLLIYHWAEHLPYFDRKLWVEVSEAVFRTRKQADTRWGPIPDAYITHIWAAFLQYGQPPGDPASYDRFSGIAPVRPRDMDRLARQYWDASPGSEART